MVIDRYFISGDDCYHGFDAELDNEEGEWCKWDDVKEMLEVIKDLMDFYPKSDNGMEWTHKILRAEALLAKIEGE